MLLEENLIVKPIIHELNLLCRGTDPHGKWSMHTECKEKSRWLATKCDSLNVSQLFCFLFTGRPKWHTTESKILTRQMSFYSVLPRNLPSKILYKTYEVGKLIYHVHSDSQSVFCPLRSSWPWSTTDIWKTDNLKKRKQ